MVVDNALVLRVPQFFVFLCCCGVGRKEHLCGPSICILINHLTISPLIVQITSQIHCATECFSETGHFPRK